MDDIRLVTINGVLQATNGSTIAEPSLWGLCDRCGKPMAQRVPGEELRLGDEVSVLRIDGEGDNVHLGCVVDGTDVEVQ